jgi:ubiquinol-cytochrome c reductase cytochrome c subunit
VSSLRTRAGRLPGSPTVERTTTTNAAAARQVHRRLGSWLVLIAGVVALAFWWSARAGAQEASEQAADQGGDVALGAQLYSQACAQCHAADGSGAIVPGTDRRAPALTGRPEITAAYMDVVLRTGRMPPAADPFDNQPREVAYDDEQRAAIVAWTVQQFDLAEDIPAVPEGNAGRGQSVYAANCAQCHGSTGAGGVAGGGAWTPDVSSYDAVTVAEAVRVGPFQMPAFGPEQITDQELGDVAAFLEEVSHEEGTPVGLVELNPVFASGFVALLALAMILSLFWISAKPTWFPDPERPDEPHGGNPGDVADPSEHPTDSGGPGRDE